VASLAKEFGAAHQTGVFSNFACNLLVCGRVSDAGKMYHASQLENALYRRQIASD
jgi:hypothetical protein